MNTDMRKFESSQTYESRAQFADSSKALRNLLELLNVRFNIIACYMQYTYFFS